MVGVGPAIDGGADLDQDLDSQCVGCFFRATDATGSASRIYRVRVVVDGDVDYHSENYLGFALSPARGLLEVTAQRLSCSSPLPLRGG